MSKNNPKHKSHQSSKYQNIQNPTNRVHDQLKLLEKQIQSINKKVSEELLKILTALDKKQTMKMSIIIEEETDRSICEEQQYLSQDENDIDYFISKISNRNVGKLKKISEQTDQLLKIYADQMYSLCQQIYNWQQKNRNLNDKQKKTKQKIERLAIQNQQLKDQITAISSTYINQKNQSQQYQQLFDSKNKLPQESRKGNKTKVRILHSDKEPDKKQQQHVKQIEKQNSKSINKMNHTVTGVCNSNKIDNEKWKQLSTKINELKSKLTTYQQQIENKNNEIEQLRIKLEKKHNKMQNQQQTADKQQLKKLKKSNTNLRGEKTILQNQIASLKKVASDKSEYVQVQQQQLQQYRSQICSLNATVQFQKKLIEQLNASMNTSKYRRQMEKESDRQNEEQLDDLREKFGTFVLQQQRALEQICESVGQVQARYQASLNVLNQNIRDLESILEQKNQYIVSIKARQRSKTTDRNDTAYYVDLVKNLTRKVAENEETIRLLTNTH